MEQSPINNGKTYKYCAVQLNLFSLMLVTSLVGFCGGIMWAIILSMLDFVGIIQLVRFKELLINALAFPLLGLVFGSLFSVVGYPLYSWVCKNIKGQKLSGTFHNPR